jgi:hypothetical protein
MNWRFKLVLMNLAVVAALYYRWSRSAAMVPLIVTGVVVLLLVNVLLLFTRTKSATGRR